MRMTPAEALTAVHRQCRVQPGSAARAIGSLEPGKQADFVIHDVADYREIPYFAGIESARATYIHGEQVYAR